MNDYTIEGESVTGGPICPDCHQIIKNMTPPCDCREGKTLIGTCGDCSLWTSRDNEGWGICGKDQSNGQIGTVGFNFGCIHWKEKEKP